MKLHAIRMVLGGGLLLASTVAPAPAAHAWACIDEVGRALCLVVGTTCRAVPERYQPLCTFG